MTEFLYAANLSLTIISTFLELIVMIVCLYRVVLYVTKDQLLTRDLCIAVVGLWLSSGHLIGALIIGGCAYMSRRQSAPRRLDSRCPIVSQESRKELL